MADRQSPTTAATAGRQPLRDTARGAWILGIRALRQLAVMFAITVAVLVVGYLLGWGVWSVPAALLAAWIATLR